MQFIPLALNLATDSSRVRTQTEAMGNLWCSIKANLSVSWSDMYT